MSEFSHRVVNLCNEKEGAFLKGFPFKVKAFIILYSMYAFIGVVSIIGAILEYNEGKYALIECILPVIIVMIILILPIIFATVYTIINNKRIKEMIKLINSDIDKTNIKVVPQKVYNNKTTSKFNVEIVFNFNGQTVKLIDKKTIKNILH